MSEKQQQQQEQQPRQDSAGSDAFDNDYGDDPDDFVASQKPSGSSKRGANTNTKNKQGSVYSSKHSRIKQAQRESRSNTKPAAPTTKK